MFDIGWSELLVVGLVALVVVGPKELPALMRTIGSFVRKAKQAASSFQDQFQEAIDQSELKDLKDSVDGLGRDLSPENIMNKLDNIDDYDQFDLEEWNRQVLQGEGSNKYKPPRLGTADEAESADGVVADGGSVSESGSVSENVQSADAGQKTAENNNDGAGQPEDAQQGKQVS